MARARQAAHNAPAVIPPQGRLTLTTGTPVMTADAAAQTTIYYTPYVGDRVPLYNGTEWENKVFSELSIAMAASVNWAVDKIFDLFVYNDAGTLRLVTGAAWTSDSARSEALVRTNGIWLNNASFTGRYGAASTVSIAASRATYVGSFRTTAAGTTAWEIGGAAAGGDRVVLGIWNAYNRVQTSVTVTDTTASWSYTSATVRFAQGGGNNYAAFLIGLVEDSIQASCCIRKSMSASSFAYFGIGYNSSTAMVRRSLVYAITPAVAVDGQYPCVYEVMPSLGWGYVSNLEQGDGATAHTSYGANNLDMFLTLTGMF